MAPLNHERMHVNAVLLPDRTVLAVGGGVTREASARSNVVDPEGGREVFEAEIYDPRTNRWSVTAPATVARLYHSVALLLPDGRVVAAGGNPDKGSQVDWLPPDPLEEMRLEIFSPPYLFRKARRPEISQVDVEIKYGTQVPIRTPDADNLRSACLIRPGLTHSFNSTQRLVDLPIAVSACNEVRANVPTDRAVMPACWYMLFLTDNDGVPSVVVGFTSRERPGKAKLRRDQENQGGFR
jgi:galactose oxidase-like protein